MKIVQSTYQKKIIQELIVSVQFGMPSKNCRNFGICRIEKFDSVQKIEDQIIAPKERVGLAILTVYKDWYLTFKFLKIGITEDTIKKFFIDKTFLIEEDCPLPNWLANSFGVDEAFIQQGVFVLIESLLQYNLCVKAYCKNEK